MRLCFWPCPMSTVFTSTAWTCRSAACRRGRCSLFDTSVVNQRQRSGTALLWVIIRCTKPSSPPSHQSSPAEPPKFDVRAAAGRPPRFRCLRRLLAAASSADAWNGGLHMDAAKRSPGTSPPLKQSVGEGCSRHSIRSATVVLAFASLRAQSQATGSISVPTKRQPVLARANEGIDAVGADPDVEHSDGRPSRDGSWIVARE